MIGLHPGKHMGSWSFWNQKCVVHCIWPAEPCNLATSVRDVARDCLSSWCRSDWEMQLPAKPTCSSLPCPALLSVTVGEKVKIQKLKCSFYWRHFIFISEDQKNPKLKLQKSGTCYVNDFIFLLLPNTCIQCLPFPFGFNTKERWYCWRPKLRGSPRVGIISVRHKRSLLCFWTPIHRFIYFAWIWHVAL